MTLNAAEARLEQLHFRVDMYENSTEVLNIHACDARCLFVDIRELAHIRVVEYRTEKLDLYLEALRHDVVNRAARS